MMDLTGIGSVADFATGIMDRFFPKQMTAEEKAAKAFELQQLIEQRDANRDNVKRDIIVAELNQGDTFTKRARPAIVYTGLAVIVLNYVLFPQLAWWVNQLREVALEIPQIVMPEEFWWSWASVCSIYALGRTAEKRGAKGAVGKVAGMITGNR